LEVQQQLVALKSQGELSPEQEKMFLNVIQGYFREYLLTHPSAQANYYFESLKHMSSD
jgi:hypothetical protein